MEPPTARLHNKIARRQVQVVYYLHRGGGHVEHPHLVEGVLLPAQDGLRLKAEDFKNWLSVLRGAGMPDSFSWSYKRSYKAGFIWQDLSNDDLIYPLQKNEYVLMGFELQHSSPHQGAKLCKCDQVCEEKIKAGRKPVSMESAKIHELLKEGIMDYLNASPIKDVSLKVAPDIAKTIHMDRDEYRFGLSCSDSFKAENLQSSLAGFSDCDDILQQEMGPIKCSADMRLSMTNPLTNMHRSGEVKVYKAKDAEQTSDAATQTGESKRCSTEEASSTAVTPHHFSGSMVVAANNHCESRNGLNGNHSPLFKPQQIQSVFDHADDFRLKEDLLPSKLYASSGLNAPMTLSLSTTASNKSDIFYSPSSVHSNGTAHEATSPGSARSLRSMNSYSSTRFSGNQMLSSSMDDQPHGKSSALIGDAGSSSPLKSGKRCSSAHIFKQLLSCGSVSISESSIMTLKAMSFHSISSGTPLNAGSHAGTPTKSMETPLSQGRGIAFQSQQYDESSPPATPKSWLCRPCGSYSSCRTPFEGHPLGSPQSCLASREGSFKGPDMRNTSLTQPSPESVASKRNSCPPVLHISPPAIALNCSLSPKQITY